MPLRLLGVLILVFGLSSALTVSADAQDRSVPRFGPLVAPDTVVTGPFERGRLWSVANPPLEYFEKQYGVRADERGLRHARLGTVRLPGCSGALVSSRGLVLTAARCVRSFLPKGMSDSARAASFYAGAQDQEKALPGLYAERVVEVKDVTARVDSIRGEGRKQVQEQLQQDTPANQRVEVVPEAGGTRFVAYTYRRFSDVRLAFLPDRAVTVLGRLGQPLTYPQHAWDVAVLRLYNEGEPLQTPQHLEVRRQGARPGDAVFAVAHPSATQRDETAGQLAFRRDVQLPARMAALDTWTTSLRQYVDTASSSGAWRDREAEVRAERRRVQARLESLQNEYLMNRLRKRDRQLQQNLDADSAGAGENDGLIERLAAIQSEKRTYADRYRAFWGLLHPNYASSTLRRALLAYRMKETERTFTDLESALQSVPAQPFALDVAAMAAHLRRLKEFLGPDSTLTPTLDGFPSATSLVRASVFSNAKQARTRMKQENVPENDPVLGLISAFYDRYVDFQASWSELVTREKRLTDSLARIRHRIADLPVALPQDRALRIADGRIRGYPYNGTLAPPFTTFYGLYGQHYATRTEGASSLPDRWQSPPASFEQSTPLVTAASTDLGGGAYGGPLLNTSLQVVGVVVDGNVQSAAGAYLFLPQRMRAVAVDVRGVLEGLSAIYGADRLVREMRGEGASP